MPGTMLITFWGLIESVQKFYKMTIVNTLLSQMRKKRLMKLLTQGQMAGKSKHITLPLSIKWPVPMVKTASAQPTPISRAHPGGEPASRSSQHRVPPAKSLMLLLQETALVSDSTTQACESCHASGSGWQ